ncbi:MAG: 3-isopropylmalate dehydratase small subunit [Alphaproteobacteria bacterium]|jgi:3-isopropylmalate/(R)-2-methylmalate dehydratase small subunit|nr:3-isopropylmalate dehydratase small subunit [Alphaproteobacteria bacterium]MDP7543985.1 3-isopropylmalate dehydratase small subunit [Alphaproteobacteria bacterium]MEE1568746.1 3-isopropylmalate dehydratase small subunit [Alphaproteobacteria bacterium]
MEKFTTLTGIAAPLAMENIDTDMIIPKQFLKTIKRTGLGAGLFYEHRFDEQGEKITDFVLNRAPYNEAKILVTGGNFGCGSSREHAPWALLDFGIRCVIAPSFADIFHNNCFKNGILPITLSQEEVDRLMDDAERGANATLTVDLETQTITEASSEEGNGGSISFEIDPFNKQYLLEGHDDIALTLKREDKIEDFEAGQKQSQPWQWIGQTQEGET